MWKPASVVPEHRRRATAIWGALLLAIVGYTAWQIVTLHRKFDNPNTNLSMSDDLYEFPLLGICVREREGCDDHLPESWCIGSALLMVYDPCKNGTDVSDVEVPSQESNCRALNLASVDMEGFKNGYCDDGTGKPSTRVTMAWFTSVAPEDEEYYGETVGVFLGNGSTRQYVTVPYSRVVTSPDKVIDGLSVVRTYMTIGKTARKSISGDASTSYPVLSLWTGNLVYQNWSDFSRDPNGDGSPYAFGYVDIVLTQGSYSLMELTDINPLDIGTILGNIGGFWELLLMVWGLCFIATGTQSPTLRCRCFTQPIRRGEEIINKTYRSSTEPTTLATEGCGEKQRYWSTANRGQQESTGDSITGIPPVGASPPINVEASSFGHPIEQEHPRRSFSNYTSPTVLGESSVATGDKGSTRQQTQQLTYADCA